MQQIFTHFSLLKKAISEPSARLVSLGTDFPVLCAGRELGQLNPAGNFFILPRCGEPTELPCVSRVCQGQTCKLWLKIDNCANKTGTGL